MASIVPNNPQGAYAICPKCGSAPEKSSERTVLGITRGTYSHGDQHVWITEWAA